VTVRVLVQAVVAAPGGSVTVLRDLVAAWPSSDDVVVVCWRPEAARLLADAGAPVVTVPARSTPEALLRLRVGTTSLRGWQPDVIWSQAARLPGQAAPQAVHWRDIGSFTPIHPPTMRRQLKERIEHHDLRRSDLRIFNSDTMRSAALARYPDLRGLESVVMPNGLELRDFLAVEPPASPGPRPLHLLLPQSDAPHKRNPVAVEVVARLDADPPPPFIGARLTVLGAGEYSDLRTQAEEWSVGHLITFLGYLDRAEVAAVHAGADLVLLTSSGESFCNPAVEAAATGRALVGPPLPVLRETGGPLAVLAADGSSAALVAATRLALRHAQSADLAAARAHAERFTATAASTRLRAVLRELLDVRTAEPDRNIASGRQ
jgi:glycosyltransferase involved in cell wall biosynthesis